MAQNDKNNSHKHITRLTFNAKHEAQPEFLAVYATLGMFAKNLKDEMSAAGHLPIVLCPQSGTSFFADFDMESLCAWFMREGENTPQPARARAEEYIVRVQQIMLNWNIDCKRLTIEGVSIH